MPDFVNPLARLVYRLVVAVDLEGYSKLHAFDQAQVQERLGGALDRAARNSGLDRSNWYRQERGDGELAVLPADVDPAHVVAEFTEHLASAQMDLRRAGTPLRMRLAMHCGPLTAGAFGLVGDAPIVTCRLLDAKVVRDTLASSTEDDLVLIISQQLYDDVVRTRFYGLDPARFRPTKFRTKQQWYSGYLCVGAVRSVPRAG